MRLLVISSSVYNEIASEPTVLVVPLFATEPDAGFGVDLGDGWPRPAWSPAFARTGWASEDAPWTSRC